MELDMALEIIESAGVAWTEAVRQAAEAAGGDVIFVLPETAEGAVRHRAMVRLRDRDEERLIAVREEAEGYAVEEEAEIAPDLVEFARASIEVLERLLADDRVVSPLRATGH
jgi:hypothetical protein